MYLVYIRNYVYSMHIIYTPHTHIYYIDMIYDVTKVNGFSLVPREICFSYLYCCNGYTKGNLIFFSDANQANEA